MKDNEIAVLYSGGTDSTLTAALAAQRFDKVHLLSFQRFGFHSIDNTRLNAGKLAGKYGNKFVHHIIRFDRIFKAVSYERYLKNFIRHRFFLLSTCGLCKLAMHLRSAIFCIDNRIGHVCDGANKGMNIFPAQMKEVIDLLKDMYKQFGIEYSTPVFELSADPDTGFIDRLHLEKILPKEKMPAPDAKEGRDTAGRKLFEMGLMPSENVKGTPLDRKMQARCFQFILFNNFVLWYYLYNRDYDQYKEATVRFYGDKISHFTKKLKEYAERGRESAVYSLIEDRESENSG